MIACRGHCNVAQITMRNKKEGLEFGQIPIGETATR